MSAKNQECEATVGTRSGKWVDDDWKKAIFLHLVSSSEVCKTFWKVNTLCQVRGQAQKDLLLHYRDTLMERFVWENAVMWLQSPKNSCPYFVFRHFYEKHQTMQLHGTNLEVTRNRKLLNPESSVTDNKVMVCNYNMPWNQYETAS